MFALGSVNHATHRSPSDFHVNRFQWRSILVGFSGVATKNGGFMNPRLIQYVPTPGRNTRIRIPTIHVGYAYLFG